MINTEFVDATEIIPHKFSMALIREARKIPGGAEAIAYKEDLSLFTDANGGIPSWLGIELMAQTASAYAGFETQSRNESPKLAFLLGARKYQTYIADFAEFDKFVITTIETFRDENNLAIFDCVIHTQNGNLLLAEAEIKAIEPKSVEDYF